MERLKKLRVCVLVKAYPQRSAQYVETVCCAGITVDTGELIRLYPILYRSLRNDQRFERYDVIEVEAERNNSDFRPESYKVNPDSIRIVQRGKKLTAVQKVELWAPHVEESLVALKLKNQESNARISLGIIRPDPDTLRFRARKLLEASKEAQEVTKELIQQVSLFEEDRLKPLPKPEFAFEYHFKSAGKMHRMTIHDWEVQAAYFEYKRRYGGAAMTHLESMYQEKIPADNLHFIMGTALAYPKQFMIIGLLRSQLSPQDVLAQGALF